MRESYTGVLERNTTFSGAFCTEPFEAAWAAEARWFIQILGEPSAERLEATTQISPDGLTWCDLETDEAHVITGAGLLSWPISRFGGWLRLRGRADGGQTQARVYLCLKE